MVTVGSILSGTFRFVGNNVRAILVWSAIIFVLNLVMMAMMRPLYETQIAMLQQAGAPPAMPAIGPFFLAMLVGLAVFVMLAAATFRAVLFPEQGRFAYLRLGMDELRLLGCALVLIICFYLIMIVVGVAMAMVLALVSATLGGSAVTGALLVGVPMLILSAWLTTRLALAGPLTILQRKIVIGPAWRLSRGHFWQLLGAYVVIVLILFAVYAVIFLIRMGPAMTDMFHPTDQAAALRVATAQTAAYTLSLVNVIIVLATSLIMGLAHALYAGGVAVATAQLVDRGGSQRLSDVFE